MMTRLVSLTLCAALLAACQDETAALPDPIDVTADSAGFYCQMALLEHDGPKGQIHLDGMPAPLFFSQVKDAVAYLHMPEQSHAVMVTYVQDMTSGTWDNPGAWVRAEDAVYVIGSRVMGGMDAPEFVPFSSDAAAQKFADENGGEVRRFETITAEDTLAAPEPVAADADDGTDEMAARLNALSQSKGN
ncbi:nitrous oxide reductase accessory protein NosL [Celeribacter sp.]|uniref:nitrous oxide reductase accessory protein NosL n=1 Tax=Celeribacter sp. TaxID=1890673 RepID=UPI003A9560A7